MAKIRITTKTTAIMIKGRYLPNGFQLKPERSGIPTPESAAPSPLPAIGVFSQGFLLGSFYASPTGSASASSFLKMSIENIKIPFSSSGLHGFKKVK